MKLLIFLLLSTLTFAQTGKSVLTQAQKDSIGAMISDSLQFTTSDDSLITDKTIVYSDSNYTWMKLHSNVGWGDWYGTLQNFYVNTAVSRPDQVMRLGYNISPGGDRVLSTDGAMSLSMESHYDGNAYPAFEMHLSYIDSLNHEYRWLSSDFNKTTHRVSTLITSDYTNWETNSGTQYRLDTDSSQTFYTVPHTTSYTTNNMAFIKQYNDSNGVGYNAYLSFPYFDNQNRLYLGDAQTFYAGSETLTLDSTNLALSNSYGIKAYNSGGNLTNVLYYDSDKLRLNSYTGQPIYLNGSHIYYEDSTGGIFDIVKPSYPFDTTSVDIGDKYIDSNTGVITIVLGTNVIINGTFDNWTNWKPDDWVASTPDTTNFYYENDSGKLKLINNADISQQIYQTGALAGHTYGYSFTVSQVIDTPAVSIAGGTYYITHTGNYNGEVTCSSSGNIVSIYPGYYGASSEITIDDIRVWDIDSTKSAPPFNLSKLLSGIDTFTTSATEDTISNATITTDDVFLVSINDATPVANDLLSWTVETGRLIVHRPAGTTSGLSYSYMRIK